MVVFDTGALIALERNDREVTVVVAEARRRNDVITVPAGCVAQAWRSPPRQARLASFLRLPNVDVAALDAGDARRVGLLLSASSSNDVVDAHVALCAARDGGVVFTSDPDDLQELVPQITVHRV